MGWRDCDWQRLIYQTSGAPGCACRELVSHLSEQYRSVPVIGFSDFTPDGMRRIATLKYGGRFAAQQVDGATTPRLVRGGLSATQAMR